MSLEYITNWFYAQSMEIKLLIGAGALALILIPVLRLAMRKRQYRKYGGRVYHDYKSFFKKLALVLLLIVVIAAVTAGAIAGIIALGNNWDNLPDWLQLAVGFIIIIVAAAVVCGLAKGKAHMSEGRDYNQEMMNYNIKKAKFDDYNYYCDHHSDNC